MKLSSGQIKLFSIATGIVLIFVLVFVFFTNSSAIKKQSVDLTIWGVGDLQSDFQKVFADFSTYVKQQPQYGNMEVHIQYKGWRASEYENVLLNQLAGGKGPDIFYIHNTWLPKYHNKLLPLPATQMTLDDFKSIFVNVAAADLIYNNQIYALPHYVDTLALYYNTTQYQASPTGSSKPAPTWSAFKGQVSALTNKATTDATLLRSGAALGTAKNIKYAMDLLYLFLVQRSGHLCLNEACSGISLTDNIPFRNSLADYLSYSEPTSSNYSWSSSFLKGLENSNIFNDIDAFIRGRVSSVFAYASDYDQIKALGAANNLNFAIAEVPQTDELASDNEKVAFANYWSMAVSHNTANAQLSWDFIKFLTSKPVLAAYYAEHPRPASREDMMNTSTENPLRVFDRQAKYAKSVIVFDDTSFNKILSDNIESLATKATTLQVSIKKLETDLNNALAPYLQLSTINTSK